MKFDRAKKRQFLLSFFYRFSKLPFATKKGKLKLFLRLHWIFWRLTVEQGAKVYKLEDNPARKEQLKFLLGKIEPDVSIIDVGCKYGDISALVAKKAKKVLGVDQDAAALEIARNRHKNENISFLHSDAFEYLDKHDEKFDVAILSHIVEHLDEPEKFLSKAKNYFKFIYVEVPDFDDSSFNHYRKALGETLIYTDNDHIWEFDRDSFREMLVSSGLEVVDYEARHGVLKFWCKNP